MKKKQEKDIPKKGRLTLTGNKMPDDVYKKLEEKGSDRKLTPYIVSLVEKEVMMDKLIEGLSTLLRKVDCMDEKFSRIEMKLESGSVFIKSEAIPEEHEIEQGDLKINENIIGGIEEDIEEMDF